MAAFLAGGTMSWVLTPCVCVQAEVGRLRAELAESKQAAVAAGDTQQRLADAVAAAESQVDAQRAETARVQAESEARARRVDDLTAELQAAHVQIATVRRFLVLRCGRGAHETDACTVARVLQLTDELAGVQGERQALKGALDDANKANAELEVRLAASACVVACGCGCGCGRVAVWPCVCGCVCVAVCVCVVCFAAAVLAKARYDV